MIDSEVYIKSAKYAFHLAVIRAINYVMAIRITHAIGKKAQAHT